MIYNVTFTALLNNGEDEPQNVRKVALVTADSTTEASANLLKVLTETRRDLNFSSITVSTISPAHIAEIHFDDTKEEIFYKVRVGLKGDVDKKFKFFYWVFQADSLCNAVAKAEQIGKDSEKECELYSGSHVDTLVVKELVGDYAL